jgi:outer membrane protein OmpA-like peptidoglycan-associated protein
MAAAARALERSQVEACGEALPVATSDTPKGRDQNWCVDVWLR